MDAKGREQMIEAMEAAFLRVGAKDYEDGMRTFTRFLWRLWTWAQFAETKEKLRETLESVPPVSRAEEKVVLLAMKSLPFLMRFGLKMLADKAARDLPALPGGRPPALTAEGRRQMVAFIAGLFAKGTPLKAAKIRAGQRFGVGRSTVEQVWTSRAEDFEDEPTWKDAVDYLATGETPKSD